MKRALSILTLTLAVGALGACDLAQSPIGPLDIDMIEAPVGNGDPVPTIPTPVCDPPANGDVCPVPTTTTIAPPVDCSNSNSDVCRPTCDVDPVRCVTPPPSNGD